MHGSGCPNTTKENRTSLLKAPMLRSPTNYTSRKFTSEKLVTFALENCFGSNSSGLYVDMLRVVCSDIPGGIRSGKSCMTERSDTWQLTYRECKKFCSRNTPRGHVNTQTLVLLTVSAWVGYLCSVTLESYCSVQLFLDCILKATECLGYAFYIRPTSHVC